MDQQTKLDIMYQEYCADKRERGEEPLDREGYEQMMDDMEALA